MVVGLIKLDLQLSIFGLLLLLLWGRLKKVVVHGDVDVRYQEGRRGPGTLVPDGSAIFGNYHTRLESSGC